jgi:hypothetical protein
MRPIRSSLCQTVLSIVIACPFLAVAQVHEAVDMQSVRSTLKDLRQGLNTPAQDSAQEANLFDIKNSFRASGSWKYRLQNTDKAQGGGVVDGGGGNISEGQLLDRKTQENLTPLPVKSLQNLVLSAYGERLQLLERSLPGFRSWLFAGFSIPWSLDASDSMNSICKNESLYSFNRQTVACQWLSSVNLRKSWFLDPRNEGVVADILIHELIRYQAIRLGKEKKLSRKEQDDITARTTVLILDPRKSASELYSSMRETGLLLDPEQAEYLRLRDLKSITQSLLFSVKMIFSTVKECSDPTLPPGRLKIVQDSYAIYTKSLQICNDFAKPETADTRLCEPMPNVQEAVQVGLQNCR